MESQDKPRASLLAALEAGGWVWENERLYAPNRTFWTEGTKGQNLACSTLVSMREKMKATLEKLRENQPAHLGAKEYEDWISDMESLVGVLNKLVEESQIA